MYGYLHPCRAPKVTVYVVFFFFAHCHQPLEVIMLFTSPFSVIIDTRLPVLLLHSLLCINMKFLNIKISRCCRDATAQCLTLNDAFFLIFCFISARGNVLFSFLRFYNKDQARRWVLNYSLFLAAFTTNLGWNWEENGERSVKHKTTMLCGKRRDLKS